MIITQIMFYVELIQYSICCKQCKQLHKDRKVIYFFIGLTFLKFIEMKIKIV